jgi:hypothetical protein
VWDGTDSSTANVNQKSAFVWIGKDGRYLDVHCNYHDLYTHTDGQGWLEFKVTVGMRRLGSEETSEPVVFEFEKRKRDASSAHSIEECILKKDYQAEAFFNDVDVRRVADWLKLELGAEISSKAFMQILLHMAVNQEVYFYREDGNLEGIDEYKFNERGLDEDNNQSEEMCQKYNEEIKELNGDMAKEISKLMQCFLNGEKYWASKTKVALDGLLLRLSFVDCINNRTQFSSDGAKKELVDLFERAKVTRCILSKNSKFVIPKTRYSKETSVFCNNQEIELNLQGPGAAGIFFVEATYEGSVKDNISDVFVQLMTSDEMLARMSFETIEGAQKAFDNQKFEKVIQEMKLKHVTASDFLALILLYCDPPPKAHGGQDESEDEEDGEENEFSDG